MERKKILASLVIALMCLVPVWAYEGLSVATNYPSVTTGETELIIFDLTVKNFDLPPQRIDLSVEGLPAGWDYEFVGGGGLVDAVFVEPESSTDVQLWVAFNDQSKQGAYEFIVKGSGDEQQFSLPLTVNIEKELPQRLELDPELPSVKGAPNTDFTFNVKLNNHSAREVLVDLDAQVPDGFRTSFAKQYGGETLSTIPLESGRSESLRVTVTVPEDTPEGVYPITVLATTGSVRAVTHLSVEVEGMGKLEIAGPGGLLSTTAIAGKEKTITLEVSNKGTAEVSDITFSSYKPNEWQVRFEPDSLKGLAAGETREIQAVIQPSSNAITGDYNVTLRANGENHSTSERFRVTVETASVWGVVAILIIAAAAVVLVLAVRKFGRR